MMRETDQKQFRTWKSFAFLYIRVMQKTPEKYDLWNEKSKALEFSDTEIYECRVGQVLRYYEGMNIGNEISKDENFKRPCLILHKRLYNGLVMIAPITSKYHHWLDRFLIPIANYQVFWLKESWIIINQVKLISPKRLIWVLHEHVPSPNLSSYIIKQYKNIF